MSCFITSALFLKEKSGQCQPSHQPGCPCVAPRRAQSCPSLPCHQRSWMGPFPVPYPALPLSSALFLNQGCASLWQGGGHLGCAWHLILMAGKAIWAQPRRQLLVLSEVALVPVCQGSAFCCMKAAQGLQREMFTPLFLPLSFPPLPDSLNPHLESCTPPFGGLTNPLQTRSVQC